MAKVINFPRSTEFGDGSDGALTISSNANPSQAEYNLTSLTIDAGVTWAQQLWSTQYFPFVTVRCQSPIILNGTLSADGVACSSSGFTWAGNGGWRNGPPYGVAATLWANNGSNGAESINILPIQGGPAASDGSAYITCLGQAADFPTDLYTASYKTLGGASRRRNTADWEARAKAQIGFGRRFVIAAGAGGSADGSTMTEYGGNGGGAWIIYAPAIIFGASGSITATGGDGDSGGVGAGTGGGGGGSIQTYTLSELSAADKAKCDVSGGTGTGSAENGDDGLLINRIL